MTTFVPGPGEDGYALRDEESAAEALGYPPVPRESTDEDAERAYYEAHPEEADNDRPTPEEQAYALYEALVDPFDEAVLRSQEAEGQPVAHLRDQRRQEIAGLLPELGLDDQVADQEAER